MTDLVVGATLKLRMRVLVRSSIEAGLAFVRSTQTAR
jgi:hypothetical protein